jgi:hypothetical protein
MAVHPGHFGINIRPSQRLFDIFCISYHIVKVDDMSTCFMKFSIGMKHLIPKLTCRLVNRLGQTGAARIHNTQRQMKFHFYDVASSLRIRRL